VQIQPDYAKTHYNLGVVYASQEQYGRAAASYQAAARLDPENPRLLYNRLGRHREAARRQYQRLKTLDPKLAKQLLQRF
jgi:cytochrome c-type biogenesis protein CcmH/NrfG